MSERERWWREVMARWAGSRSSVVEFCRREGVSTASFYQWRRRLDEAGGGDALFVPVRVTADSGASASVEVSFPSGVVVRVADGADRGTIADVLAALGVKG